MTSGIASAAALTILSLHVAHGAWGYDRGSGPATWGTAFPACAGKFQSPVDIVRGQVYGSEVGGKRGQWLEIKFMDAGPIDGRLINDGRRVRFYPTAKDGFLLRGISFRGEDYFLQHIDFHKNSEHLVDGARFAFETQFQLTSSHGERLALAVLFTNGQASMAGANSSMAHEAHLAMQEMSKFNWTSLAIPSGEASVVSRASGIDLSHLFPRDTEYFRYSGSDTIPPCAEGVEWLVFAQPVKLTLEQILSFPLRSNARPPQPLGLRRVEYLVRLDKPRESYAPTATNSPAYTGLWRRQDDPGAAAASPPFVAIIAIVLALVALAVGCAVCVRSKRCRALLRARRLGGSAAGAISAPRGEPEDNLRRLPPRRASVSVVFLNRRDAFGEAAQHDVDVEDSVYGLKRRIEEAGGPRRSHARLYHQAGGALSDSATFDELWTALQEDRFVLWCAIDRGVTPFALTIKQWRPAREFVVPSLHASTTVAELKARIRDAQPQQAGGGGGASQTVRLSFHSHELDDASTLEEARIFDGSLVHLQLSSEADAAPLQATHAEPVSASASQQVYVPFPHLVASASALAEGTLIDLGGSPVVAGTVCRAV